MMNPKTDPELRRKCAADLLPYLHPRLNSVEQHVTGQTETLLTVISGIARLPNDPPIDVTPAAGALPPPATDGAPVADASISQPVPDEMPAGRPQNPSPFTSPPNISPGHFDSKSDEALDRERSADAQIRELNARASRFIA
jgi:hypothetical protein